MAWKAKLKSIADNASANDTANVTIEFRDEVSGKTFDQNYNFHAGDPSVASEKSFKEFAAAELAKLNNFDGVKSVLAGLIDQDL